MPEDKAPEESASSETPAQNIPAQDSTDDGAVSAEELAAYSQPPSPLETPVTDAAVPVVPITSVTPDVSPFGASSFGTPVPETSVPDLQAPQKSSKKKKIIILGAIIVGALGLLSGGTAAAYNLWYQNPDKVVLEAVSSLLQQGTSTHKMSVDITAKDTTVKLTIDAKLAAIPASEADITAAITYRGKDYKVTGSTLTDKDGNLYFKLNDVKALLTQVAGNGADFSAFNDVITKVDGQWIKVSSDDLKTVSDAYSKTQSCTTDALKSLNDKAVSKEITDVYQKNQFITVGDKIGVKDIGGVASLGYNVTLDAAKAKTFYTTLGDTTVGKALTACDSSLTFEASDLDTSTSTDSKTTSKIQVWASRFGHQLKELDVTAKDADTTIKFVWNPTFVKGVTVTAPASTVSVSEVVKDIENDFSTYYSSVNSSNFSPDFSSGVSTTQQAFKLTSLL